MKSLFEHLLDYSQINRTSFAMPGHKGGRGFSDEFSKNIARIDTTELPDTENLHSPGEVLRNSLLELRKIFGSDESYYLTGGSTEGIHIMMHTVCKSGRILVNRSCHRSVINCCALSGIDVVFIPQKIHPKLFVPEMPKADVIFKMLSENSDIDAVLITSPSYYGQLADIKSIARVCHEKGVALLVDEAHGAHLAAKGIEKSAIGMGADMVVQSAHKTLNALNQAAYLHIKSDIINKGRARELLSMVATTSPSYPIVASAELAAKELLCDKWQELSEYIKKKKEQLLTHTKIVVPEGNTDPLRIVFGFSSYNISGFEVERILREKYNTDIEMADEYNVVMIATISNTAEEIDRLFNAAEEIVSGLSESDLPDEVLMPSFPRSVMSVREAFLSDAELVCLEEAEGRVARVCVAAYPPGIPLISAGEPITKEMAIYIRNIAKKGANIEGIDENGQIAVVKER